MCIFGPPARRFRSAISTLFSLLALILFYSGAARADNWSAGSLVTYDQSAWGDTPNGTNAATLLDNNFDLVYQSTFGVLEVGIPGAAGFSMQFTNVEDLLSFLPSDGTIGPLQSDLFNPPFSASGAFGGETIGLKLNVDFSNAGLLPGSSGLTFGSLYLTGFVGTSLAGLDGLTVSQLLALDNIALGGGSTPYSIGDLDTLTAQLNSSFDGGEGVGSVATEHLTATNPNGSSVPTPEPSSVLLLVSGLLGLGMLGGWQRRRGG